ncbi:MAG: hypothetical protein Q8L98_00075 [Chlamydiales bacterium]|nr:hypothetical protein [Chlamydiales bacterium]
MATCVTGLRPTLPTTWEPIEPLYQPRPNLQARILEIAMKFLETNSQSSRNEKERIVELKAKIKQLSGDQADAKGIQGNAQLGSGFVGFGVTTFLAFAGALGLDGADMLARSSETLIGGATRFGTSGYEIKELTAGSSREVLIRELDNKVSDMQGKSSTEREIKDLLEKILQLALSESRAS